MLDLLSGVGGQHEGYQLGFVLILMEVGIAHLCHHHNGNGVLQAVVCSNQVLCVFGAFKHAIPHAVEPEVTSWVLALAQDVRDLGVVRLSLRELTTLVHVRFKVNTSNFTEEVVKMKR